MKVSLWDARLAEEREMMVHDTRSSWMSALLESRGSSKCLFLYAKSLVTTPAFGYARSAMSWFGVKTGTIEGVMSRM